jgi:hypothetical protein
MEDIEKASRPSQDRQGNQMATSATSDSESDLEKAETLHPVPSAGTNLSVNRSKSQIARTRSAVTDGFSIYQPEDDDGGDEDENEGTTRTATAERTRTKTDPFEVRWNGPDDKEFPRNFSLAQKWTSIFITTFTCFCV